LLQYASTFISRFALRNVHVEFHQASFTFLWGLYLPYLEIGIDFHARTAIFLCKFIQIMLFFLFLAGVVSSDRKILGYLKIGIPASVTTGSSKKTQIVWYDPNKTTGVKGGCYHCSCSFRYRSEITHCLKTSKRCLAAIVITIWKLLCHFSYEMIPKENRSKQKKPKTGKQSYLQRSLIFL